MPSPTKAAAARAHEGFSATVPELLVMTIALLSSPEGI